ncbi:MAG TPA: class I lanthipeptide [Thermoanaerobaculia bacterium]|jgi:hypothetical protein|nr:class I lanthipeptide [Thermoanaerobaculia bacterium]
MRKKRSKLSLSRETVKQLTPSHLEMLAGGTAQLTCGNTLARTCKTCTTCAGITCYGTICTDCCTTDTTNN